MKSELLSLIVLALCWQFLAFLVGSDFVPGLLELKSALTLANIESMAFHTTVSLVRVFVSVALAATFGVGLGIFLGYHERWDKYISPFILLTYPFPKVILVPILILIFGVGEFSKILLISLVCAYQLFITSRVAVQGIPKQLILSFQSLSRSSWQLLRHVLVPATLPMVLGTLKISFQTSFALLFFTETYGTNVGIGHLIWEAFSRFDYNLVYVSSLFLCLSVWVIFKALGKLEDRFLAWNR